MAQKLKELQAELAAEKDPARKKELQDLAVSMEATLQSLHDGRLGAGSTQMFDP